MTEYNTYTWVNGTSPINANNLNNLETGITNNKNSIYTLQTKMVFKGTAEALPDNPEIGDVYELAVGNVISSNKPGDLAIYTNYTGSDAWHVIPSGSRGSGTVTSIQAGTGISLPQGPITGVGTINLDLNYTAIEDEAPGARNGLMSSTQAYRVNHLPAVALPEGGNFSDLYNIPSSATREMVQSTGESTTAVMSQNAITEALDTKSNTGHQHEISDVNDLSDYLAIDSNEHLVRAASNTHVHGLINRDGYLLNSQGTSPVGSQIVITSSSGQITSTPKLQSEKIDGVSFSNGLYNLETMKADITSVKDILTPTGTSTLMEKAATADHGHASFYTEGIASGFVDACTQDNPQNYVLLGNGQWASAGSVGTASTIIDIVYPPGSYFETSDPNFNPNTAGWPGTWVLERPGQVHVSGGGAYSVGAANENGGIGMSDGGETTHKLTANESGNQALSGTAASAGSHRHSMNGIWSNGKGKKDAYKMSSDRTLTTRYTTYDGAHTHTVSIPEREAKNAHNNMQPYINVYRWHRAYEPPQNND